MICQKSMFSVEQQLLTNWFSMETYRNLTMMWNPTQNTHGKEMMRTSWKAPSSSAQLKAFRKHAWGTTWQQLQWREVQPSLSWAHMSHCILCGKILCPTLNCPFHIYLKEVGLISCFNLLKNKRSKSHHHLTWESVLIQEYWIPLHMKGTIYFWWRDFAQTTPKLSAIMFRWP